MTRYEVTASVPNLGKVKHVIKAATRADAIGRMKRAHRHAATITTKQIKHEPPVSKSGMNSTAVHQRNLAAMMDAIPPEGITTTQLADTIGASTSAVRRWLAKVEGEGRITRTTTGGPGSQVIIRRADQ